MDAWNRRRDAPKWAASGTPGLGIPCLKLTGCATQPKQDAVLLRLLGFSSKNWIFKQSGETRNACQRATSKPLQEKAAMQTMLIDAAPAGKTFIGFIKHHQGMVKNSALLISAHSKSRTASLWRPWRLDKKAIDRPTSTASGERP